MAKGARRKKDRARIAMVERSLAVATPAGDTQAVQACAMGVPEVVIAEVEMAFKMAGESDEPSVWSTRHDSVARVGGLATSHLNLSTVVEDESDQVLHPSHITGMQEPAPTSTSVTFDFSSMQASLAVHKDVCDLEDRTRGCQSQSSAESRTKASMRPRRPRKFKALDSPTSDFSPGITLDKASDEDKANFAELFSRSINSETQELRSPEKEVDMTDEDAQDALAYSTMAQVNTAQPEASPELTSKSTAESSSFAKLLQDLEDVRISQVGEGDSDTTPVIVDRPVRRPKPTKGNGVFLQPSANARRAQLASPQAHLSSKQMRLELSFPDEDNCFYHPKMTLQIAAQQIVKNFRAAEAFIAYYCDDQIAHISPLKPIVITHMETMVRDLRWAAQFLSLGKLGWDLVTLPHDFYEDVKALILGLRQHLEKLSGRKGLRFLADGLEEVDRVEKAVWVLQGRRREIEKEARLEWEAGRDGEFESMIDEEALDNGEVHMGKKT